MKPLFHISLVFVLTGCAALNQDSANYDQQPNHKAIAIDSRGVWGMSHSQSSEEAAINQALQACASHGGINCIISKLDGFFMPISTGSSGDPEFSGARVSCEGLGKAEAYTLLMSGHRYLDRDGDGHPCEWNAHSYSVTKNKPTTSSSGNCHYVSGYRRKNGTYVSGHMRCR